MARRWVHAARFVLAIGLVAVAATALSVPWTIRDPQVRAAVIARLQSASGLSIGYTGPMVLHLLPRPAIDVRDVDMSGLNGAVTVGAAALVGRLGLTGLLRGQIEVTTALVDEPTIVADLDRLAPLAGVMVDGAETAAREPPGDVTASIARPEPLRFLRTDGLTIRSGVLRLVSKDAERDTLFTDVSATVDWPSGPGEGALSGSATWRGIPAIFTAVLDAPGDLLSGETSEGSLRLRSPVLDLLVTGEVSFAQGFHGTGRLTAQTGDLPGFLRCAGTPAPQLGAIRQAALSGQATLADGSLSLSDVELGLGDTSFEGAFVVRDEGGRPGLAGTLATERIDLNPFLAALPPPGPDGGAWSSAPFDTRSVADDDIDLRISASKALIGQFAFEDGSLSLQSGNGRMELSLGEARAYDGLLKGRVVATLDTDTTDVRAEVSLSRLDLAALAKDLSPAGELAGSATGHVSLEGRGRSYAELLGALGGRGQISVRNGAVGTRIAHDLVTVPSGASPPLAAILKRMAAFESASADIAVDRGVVVLQNGAILWPDATAALTGSTSIPLRSLDLTVAPSVASADAEVAPAPVAFALSGPWRDLKLAAAGNAAAPNSAWDR